MKEKSVATGNIERDLTLDLTRLKEYFGIQVNIGTDTLCWGM